MAGCLLQTQERSVTLSATATRRLLKEGNGDAALLYLALLRHDGQVLPRALAGELRWEKERIESAEQLLQEMQLLAPTQPKEVPLEPAQERPTYQTQEVTASLEGNSEFASLVVAVEQVLGKRLTTVDIGTLLGLYDHLGLPADVVYLLVSHCTQRITSKFGQGRRPSLKQIEKEGYAWARRGIEDQRTATEYLASYAARQGIVPQLMQVLGLGDRAPATSEEKYLHAWLEMGFTPDVVAVAYDKTMLNCQQLKWPYLNAILKKWHDAGLHTLEEIGTPKAAVPKVDKTTPQPSDEMKRYVQQLQRNKEGSSNGI